MSLGHFVAGACVMGVVTAGCTVAAKTLTEPLPALAEPRVVRRVILDCPHGCFKDYDRRQTMVCEEGK